MNNRELLNSFELLDTNNKRNKLSDELMTIGELLNTFAKSKGFTHNLNIKNYDQNNDRGMTEDEMLTFIYEDVFNIENELISLISIQNIGGNLNE